MLYVKEGETVLDIGFGAGSSTVALALPSENQARFMGLMDLRFRLSSSPDNQHRTWRVTNHFMAGTSQH
jgi:precorrin-6B methylase 2